MPRAGFVGDELGSSLIAARLVRDVMLLCFLMERQYAPYAKWFGTAFMRLQAGPELAPLLHQALRAETYQDAAKLWLPRMSISRSSTTRLAISGADRRHAFAVLGSAVPDHLGRSLRRRHDRAHHRPGRAAPHQRRTDRQH